MAGFLSPVDIWNRALDHCGGRSVTAAPPTDTSRNAAKCAEIYDKVRQAELRRNNWVFATRKAALRPVDTTTMQLVPAAYSATVQYFVGDIVSYLSEIWICQQATLSNVSPVDSNGVVSPSWDNYYGPMSVDAWMNPVSTSTTLEPVASAYHAGELVYIAPGNGTFSAFLSLVDDNMDDPLGTDAWVTGTTYSAGQIVLGSNGVLYESTTSLNSGNDPTIVVPVAAWAIGTTYAAGAYVFDTNNQVYSSNAGGNLGNAPAYNSTFWTYTGMWTGTWTTVLSPQPRATSNNWHFLSCTLQPLSIVFPVGSSWVSQPNSKNLFLLPNNFLRQAPQENQLGSRVAWAGAHDPLPDQYIFQGRYIISWDATLIILRFISDFQNVLLMDPMFCEGMSARMGWELCETLTQKPDLKGACLMAYDRTMGEARTIDAIETGPIDQTEDEYIRCRI